jgi:peptidoglycan/LPS O-acetylase OafA/YrhL
MPDRLHALDAVRGYALLLGVALHAATAFEQGVTPLWRLEPSPIAAVICYLIHVFRMSAFYLIAGFFGRLMLSRRGLRAFTWDRAKRILLPLLVGLPVVISVLLAGAALGALPYGLEYLRSQLAPHPIGSETLSGGPHLQHLWFLYYLLIFYALTLVLRGLARVFDPRGAALAVCDRCVAFLLRGVWGPVLLALPATLYYWQDPHWIEWQGLPAPDVLVPDCGALIGYGVPFMLGWLLNRQWLTLLNLQQHWLIDGLLALGLTVACLAIIGTTPLWHGPTLRGGLRVLYTAGYMLGTWYWVFALIGAAIRFLSRPSAINRYLADASYWIYLMHMGPLAFFITLLRPCNLPWFLDFVIMWTGSMAILLLSYQYLVRFTWVGAILNGRRHPRPHLTPQPEPQMAEGG